MVFTFLKNCKRKKGKKKERVTDCIWSSNVKYLVWPFIKHFADPWFSLVSIIGTPVSITITNYY